MDNNFKVILIDDDSAYAESLELLAAEMDITIIPFVYLSEGLAALEENPARYDGVILDGRGMISPSEAAVDDDHVTVGLNKMNELAAKGIVKPLIVNTGYVENIESKMKRYGKNARVFEKDDDAEMLEYLIKQMKKSSEYCHKVAHPDAFKVFENNILSNEEHKKVCRILDSLDTVDSTVIDSCIKEMRVISEAVLKNVSDARGDIIPEDITEKPNFLNDAINWLDGREYFSDGSHERFDKYEELHITACLKSIQQFGNIGSHYYKNAAHITNYTLKATTYALLEVLAWSNRIIMG